MVDREDNLASSGDSGLADLNSRESRFSRHDVARRRAAGELLRQRRLLALIA